MSSLYDSTDFLSQYFPDGLTYDKITQILFNQMARQLDSAYNSDPLTRVGIVRRVTEINDLSQVNSISSKDKILFSHTKVVYAVNIEVRNLTETYENLVNGSVSKEEFYNSLPEVVGSPSIIGNRVPQKDEVVLLDYENPNNFLSVKLAGFPFDEPFLDPNLNSYSVDKKSTAKSAFPRGK